MRDSPLSHCVAAASVSTPTGGRESRNCARRALGYLLLPDRVLDLEPIGFPLRARTRYCIVHLSCELGSRDLSVHEGCEPTCPNDVHSAYGYRLLSISLVRRDWREFRHRFIQAYPNNLRMSFRNAVHADL